jgi:putative addiction module killer protein
LIEVNDQTIQENAELSDFRYQGQPAYALGVAYLLNALAVSFNSASEWDCDSLNLEITKLDGFTDSIVFVDSIETVVHASRREHILQHHSWIKSRLEAKPWQTQDALLPCYCTAEGKNLIAEWLDSIKDPQTRASITARLSQVKQGILGDRKPITEGDGVRELRIFHPTSYRIYYGQVSMTQLILLCVETRAASCKTLRKPNNICRTTTSAKRKRARD